MNEPTHCVVCGGTLPWSEKNWASFGEARVPVHRGCVGDGRRLAGTIIEQDRYTTWPQTLLALTQAKHELKRTNTVPDLREADAG